MSYIEDLLDDHAQVHEQLFTTTIDELVAYGFTFSNSQRQAFADEYGKAMVPMLVMDPLRESGDCCWTDGPDGGPEPLYLPAVFTFDHYTSTYDSVEQTLREGFTYPGRHGHDLLEGALGFWPSLLGEIKGEHFALDPEAAGVVDPVIFALWDAVPISDAEARHVEEVVYEAWRASHWEEYRVYFDILNYEDAEDPEIRKSLVELEEVLVGPDGNLRPLDFERPALSEDLSRRWLRMLDESHHNWSCAKRLLKARGFDVSDRYILTKECPWFSSWE